MKTVLVMALSIFLMGSGCTLVAGQFEQWVHFVPSSGNVDLEYWIENQTSYISVAITFYTAGYNISSWGTTTRDGSNFFANSEIWRWTGVVAQIVWTARHIYDLGHLEDGNYTFTFLTWSVPVKGIWFKVGTTLTGDLNYDGKVDIKDIAIVALAYGSYPGHPKWNPIADITGQNYLEPDGEIDIRDIALVARHFGETYT